MQGLALTGRVFKGQRGPGCPVLGGQLSCEAEFIRVTVTGLRHRTPQASMQEERPAAEPAQAGPVSVSASPSRDADAGTGQQQQEGSQKKQAGLSVLLECQQSPWRHGPVLKEVIVSFTRRPSQEPGRNFWAHSSLQQQDGMEDREPQRHGQGSSLRRSGALDYTPGVSANSRMAWPGTAWDGNTSLPWTMGYTTPQQPRGTCRRFAERTINDKAILEQLGAQAPTSKPVAWTKDQESENAIRPELSEEEQWEDALNVEVSDEEEWQDAVDTERWQRKDDIGSLTVLHWVNPLGLQDDKGSHTSPREGPSCPTDERTGVCGTPEGSWNKECPSNECREEKGTAIVTPAAQEKPSLVENEASTHPDRSQAFTYNIHLSTLLDTLTKETQMSHRKVLSILQQALIATQEKGEQRRQQPTGCQEVVPEPAQSIRAEGLDKEPPVKEGPGQQLLEAELDLQVSMKEATEAGPSAGPAFRSPSPTVIDALARERRTSIFKSAPRVLPQAFTAMHRRGGQEEQQPTARARDLLDTGQNISSELLSEATIVIQGIKQTEEQDYLEHSTDGTLAVRGGAAGAVSPAHAPHSPTVDGPEVLDTVQYTTDEILSRTMIVTLRSEYREEQRNLEQGTAEGMRVTATAEVTKSPGHSVRSQTDDGTILPDYNNDVRTEVVKKAVLFIQKPFKYSEKKQDQELSADRSISAEKPAEHVQSLPAPTLINISAQQGRLKPVQKTMTAPPLASTSTSSTGKKEKKQPKAFGKDLLDTAECIRRDVPDRVTIEIQGSIQQAVEPSRDVPPAVTPTAVRTKSYVRETHSPTADVPVFLNASDYIHAEVVKEAMLVVQRPLEEPQELWEHEQVGDEDIRAKATVAKAGGQTHVPQSPRANGRILMDRAQYIPATAEVTKSPGHSVRRQADDSLVFLDYNNYVRTEVVKKAVLMVQKPFEYSEKKQDQELSADGSISAEKPAEHVQSLPAPTLINISAQQGRLRPVQKAVTTPPLASTSTSSTGKKEKKQPKAFGKDLLDTAESIRRDVPDKATIEIQGSRQQVVEPSRDVPPAVTPTAVRTKSYVRETHSPTADVVFQDYNDCLQTEVVRKAMRMIQEPFEYPKYLQEQEGSMD